MTMNQLNLTLGFLVGVALGLLLGKSKPLNRDNISSMLPPMATRRASNQ